MTSEHAPHNAMRDPGEIERFHDRCSDLMRQLLAGLAVAPDRPRPFPEIEDAIGWPRRRIASVLGGVCRLRMIEFEGRRPYRFNGARDSESGRWEMWMDRSQALAVRAAQRNAYVDVSYGSRGVAMSASAEDFNAQVIDEFRANEGRVGGMFEQMPLVLVHHTGAKSGANRINPVAYLEDGGRYVVFASKGGAPTNPDWYHNLIAHPETTIEVGTETIPVVASEAEGEERERLFNEMAGRFSQFEEYAQKAGRRIPVILLTPTA